MNTRLSVNVNKVATIRNTRHLGIPSIVKAAEICLLAGAHGITVHPRPDERHIRLSDVFELGALLKDWPDREFNIEGNPLHNVLDVVEEVKIRGLPVHQVTFVPDAANQFTSDRGFDLPYDNENLYPVIARARMIDIRISLFMEANDVAIRAAKDLSVQRVELYTEPYAAAFGTPMEVQQLIRFSHAANAAHSVGLGVNAGHDLNLKNLATFVTEIPYVTEVSIGHAFISDALELGYRACTKAYLTQLDQ
jgi:pyridoxine 5-phosphate synthase